MKITLISPCSASVIIKYGMKNWPILECEPSSFIRKYDEKETCLILHGEAKIRIEGESESYFIKSGDLLTFTSGLVCHWNISKTIKKHYRVGD